jgi:SagB-type dehydrogenase family enzyme
MKQLMNCTQHALPRQVPPLASGILDVLHADGASSDQSLTVDDLAAVLMLTAGVRDSQAKRPTVKRWAATGGNLGSVELYVAVRNVHGLASGFYFYQPQEHTLACFHRRGGALKIEDFMRRVIPGGPSDLPDVLVLFTAAFHRVARKYGPFAYRLIQLDAGTALSQLHLVARGLNIASRTLARWADDLIEQQLNLEALEEQATAVVALSRGESTPAPEPNGFPGHSCIPSGQPVSRKPVAHFCGLPLQEILTLLYHESRIKEDELGLGEFVVPAYLLNGGFERASTLSLPPPAHGGRSLGEVLSTRTSIRHYASKFVAVEQLSTMLHCAHHSDLKEWPEEHRLGQSLIFLTLAWRVEGLNPGVYAYDSQNHALSFVRHAPTSQETVELFLQREFAAAPMVVWIVGNLAAACARHGAFGHRKLLLRAGAAGHRLWMAASGMGLAGTVTAGVITGAARQQLGLDGYQRASLLAFPTGYAATYFRWPSLQGRLGKTRPPQVRGDETVPSDRAT